MKWVNNFHKEALSQIFDLALNTPLTIESDLQISIFKSLHRSKGLQLPGLVLATYCVRIRTQGPFCGIKCLILYLKPQKHMLYMGVQHHKCPKFEKNEQQKSTTVPFYWTFLPFLGYAARMPLFSRKSPNYTKKRTPLEVFFCDIQ